MGDIAPIEMPSGSPFALYRSRGRLYMRLPALLWSCAFAAVHVYWLIGGRIALPADVLITPGSALFYAALVAVPLLVAAGLVGLCGERWLGEMTALCLLLIVLAFCLLHSTAPMIQAGLALSSGARMWTSERELYALVYEVNWFAGGVWFALSMLALALQNRLSEQG